jgi:acyl-CoA thioester hydrolase
MPRATIRVRVPFPDVDSSQRIHFTAMFRYFELAEHELMRSLGQPYATMLYESAFPRVHLECDFSAAVRYDDQLDVSAEIERVGNSSWTVAFVAVYADAVDRRAGAAPGEIVATGRMTIVAMNPETERAHPIPPQLREALGQG